MVALNPDGMPQLQDGVVGGGRDLGGGVGGFGDQPCHWEGPRPLTGLRCCNVLSPHLGGRDQVRPGPSRLGLRPATDLDLRLVRFAG